MRLTDYSPEQLVTLANQVKAEKAERDLREYIRQAWHVVEPATPYVHGWHIDAMAEHLMAVGAGEIRNLLINVPPRHMKSLTVNVFWMTWEWTKRPWLRWLFSSYALSLSIRDSLKCRRLIESPWYQSNWSDKFQLTGDQNVKSRYDNDSTGYRISTSVDSAATGEGGDIIVADDPHSAKEAQSDTSRNSTLVWWDQTMSTRVNNPKTVAKVIVMQRLHEQDLSGHVLERGGWEHLRLPAEFEEKAYVTSIGWRDPRTQHGELLWADQFGVKELAETKRDLGSYGVSGQLQQNPSPAEGGMIKKMWWRFWVPKGVEIPPYQTRKADGSWHIHIQEELPERFDIELQSWDMAFKESTDTDFVVGQHWGKRKADKYLLDQIRGRMDFVKTIEAVKDLTKRSPRARTKLVEAKANGPAVVSALRRDMAGLIEVEPQGGKIARATAVSPTIESGNVYLPHPAIAPWVEDFINEFSTFPNGANDDQVDGASQALIRMSDASDGVFF